MSAYSITFSEEMAKASAEILLNANLNNESSKAALYIALVACEIAMKAALERAGMPVAEIKKYNHDLYQLFERICICTILSDSCGVIKRVPASQIRSIVVSEKYADATIGRLLHAEHSGASKYPNEIRYGSGVAHFPVDVVSRLSFELVNWVKSHWSDIKA